jgi:phosphatidylglycerophosphate synthase
VSPASGARVALVLAPPAGDRRVVTGLTLGERGRRVAVRAGVAAADVVVVRSAAELRATRARLAGKPLLLQRATDQVVAASLVSALRPEDSGLRHAIDPARADGYAGAWVADADDGAALLDALIADFEGGDAPGGAAGLAGEAIAVDRRARFPVPERAAVAAADRWQFELVDKPLDSPLCRYFYRPLARPLTKLFLRSPFTPNQISVLSIVLSLAGCAIGAGPSPTWHVIGMAILVFGGIVDANDGEVARLRLEMSKTGAWLDAMGDDAARIALLLGVGSHVAYLHPTWHVWAITLAAIAMTVAALLLIYWYCIFVIHSTNNQDYTKALGIGPGVRPEGRRTLGQVISDWAAEIIRRDFVDLGVLVLALVHLPEAGWIPLVAGAPVTLAIVIPTHLAIVRNLRAERAAAART